MRLTIMFRLLLLFIILAPQLICAKENIIVFHAGSLSVPFSMLEKEFEKNNPQFDVIREASGSRVCARKISELKKPADIVAVADYSVIDNLLIPEYAKFNVHFATNEMVIAYTAKSKYSENIDSNNWYNILLKDNVKVGHSNPNLDPCGYRSILVVKLAEKYYKINNYYNQLLNYGDSYENGEENRSKIIVRPKETDLLGLLESGIIDYLFIYKSVAIQHNLKYVKLPNEIALNDINFSDFYSTVNFNITGSKPSNFITVTGKPIVYGITIPEDHKIYPNNKKGAIKFLNFILSEDGRKIMENSGQNPVYPPLVTGNIIKNE